MGAPTHEAVLVDVGYCFLEVSDPVAQTYSSIAQKHGVHVDPDQVKEGFKVAFKAEWAEELRYKGDGRPFWKAVVAQAVGRCVRRPQQDDQHIPIACVYRRDSEARTSIGHVHTT